MSGIDFDSPLEDEREDDKLAIYEAELSRASVFPWPDSPAADEARVLTPDALREALAALLKERFPWLGTNEEAEAGSEVIAALEDLYESLGGKLEQES